MSGPAVHILTTEGPVAIQRISEEDPVVQSVMCLDGLAQILPVSPAYDAFVRRPVGVIERMTGHGAYRMDVAARIDEGNSWQLAAYMAHAARLNPGGEGIAVYATGEVDSALAVRPVERVRLKLDALTRHLSEHGVETEKAIILVPAGEGDLPEQIGGIPVKSVMSVTDALTFAGMPVPGKSASASSVATVRHSKRRSTPLAILLGAALIAAALFWAAGDFARWSALMEQGRLLEIEQDMARGEENVFGRWRAAVYRKWRRVSKPETGLLDLNGFVYTAGDAAACAVPDAREKRPMTQVYQDAAAVCLVEIRAITDVSDRVVIGRLAYWPDGLGNGERPARVMRGSQDAAGRTWALEFDELPEPGAALRLVVISGDMDINGPQPWYRDLLAAPVDSAAFAAAHDRLKRLGFDIRPLDWRRE